MALPMRFFPFALCCLIAFILISESCRRPLGGRSDYYYLPAQVDSFWQMVVEIPAGTNLKLEYDVKRQAFLPDSIDQQPRIVDFIPYPGNYGFVPSTMLEKAEGGDGDPMDVIVICESLPTGTVLRIQPIGALLLEDDGEVDTKIIAIPRDSSIRTLQATTFQELSIEYQPARRLLEDWFLNYKGPGRIKSLGWKDEQYAHRILEQSVVNEEEE